MDNNQGFTLVELLVTIGIVAILMSITLIALNPEKQFRSAREAKRMADVSVILNGVSQYLIDHKTEDIIPKDNISRYVAAGMYKGKWDFAPKPVQTPNINLCDILTPQYSANLPSDPFLDTEVTNCENYDSGYMITVNPSGRVIVSAPYSEIQPIVLVR
ncbi:type II secretion system protein [Candidatus Woesebacteria bacterium]|nr:type II secretion system protein [Candidatus Woesebacteria bacterium]